ncbi:hypothetical protein [Labrys miyagiensis]
MTADKDENKPASTLLVLPPEGGRLSMLRRVLRRVPWNYVGPVLSIALFVGALVVLASLLRSVKPEEVVAGFTATPVLAIALSILFTAFSYLALTGYDGLALKQIGARDISYSTAAIGSFTSYAISYTLGVPLLTAGVVRYRVYGGAGLSGPQIAALTLVCTLTFWLGMGAVLAFGLLLVPQSVAGVDHLPLYFNMGIGIILISIIIGYVAYVSTGRRVVAIEGWSMPLPGGKVTAMQIVLGVFDVCAGAGALYVLLPEQAANIPFFTFMVIYVLAAFLGVLSHSPGGLGPFEATMLVALPSIPEPILLGRIILFRVIYYFIPFALALAILGAYELARRRHFVGKMVDQVSSIMKPLAPILVSGAMFLAGGALLITGAVPASEARRVLLTDLVPLPVLELSHLIASLAGVALLFLARGLIRRIEFGLAGGDDRADRGHRRHAPAQRRLAVHADALRRPRGAGAQPACLSPERHAVRGRLFAAAARRHRRYAGGNGVDRLLRLPLRRVRTRSMAAFRPWLRDVPFPAFDQPHGHCRHRHRFPHRLLEGRHRPGARECRRSQWPGRARGIGRSAPCPAAGSDAAC